MPTTYKDTPGWINYVWLIYLPFFVLGPAFKPHQTVMEWMATGLGTVAFLLLYFRGYRVLGRDLQLVIAGITLLALLFYPFNPGGGTLFVYAAAFAGHLSSGRANLRGILIIELAILIESIVFHIPWYASIWPIVFAALIGAVNGHYSQVHRSNQKLRVAQEEIERLAKTAERERIARDLHDLLGHTLSLIVLKSELASKLADRDPQRASEEIRDVERISREALTEVRQAIGGYRKSNLTDEIDGAREMLRAAQIECAAEIEPIPLAPSQEAIVSLAVREGVTNVVRHSGASRCTIRLSRADSELRLTIADNGHSASDREGLGLTGMRERIAALGGSLNRDTSRGTTLTIMMPIEMEAARDPRRCG